MEIEINPTHLSINELNYELRIRRVVSCRGQDEKRKILRRLLVRQKTVKDLELHDPEFSFTTEQNEINATLESITQLVIEFEGNKDDSTFKRAKSRLSHISERISRLPIIVGEDDEKERLSFKNEAFATCISLEADLYDKITDQSPAVNNASSTSILAYTVSPVHHSHYQILLTINPYLFINGVKHFLAIRAHYLHF